VQFGGRSRMRCQACDAPQCEHCKRCATQQRAGYGQQNCATYSCAGPNYLAFSYFSAENGNILFQSFFMSTTVQPFALASSNALSSLPIGDWRS
jgi:hypothetical protein